MLPDTPTADKSTLEMPEANENDQADSTSCSEGSLYLPFCDENKSILRLNDDCLSDVLTYLSLTRAVFWGTLVNSLYLCGSLLAKLKRMTGCNSFTRLRVNCKSLENLPKVQTLHFKHVKELIVKNNKIEDDPLHELVQKCQNLKKMNLKISVRPENGSWPWIYNHWAIFRIFNVLGRG